MEIIYVYVFVFWLMVGTLYLGPTIVAACRSHYRLPYIFAINLLFGWTLVGLFVTFAWALSATRKEEGEQADILPTDFGERLFRNRNIVQQPDGGAIVYPTPLSDEGFWLNASEFKLYLQMRAAEIRRNLPRALVLLLLGGTVFLGFRQWLGPQLGTAPALLVLAMLLLCVAAWDLLIRPQRAFRAAFPRAPTAKDPIRHQRKVLAGIIAFDMDVCVGATLLCAGLLISPSLSFILQPDPLVLHAQDGAILLLGGAILASGAFIYGQLIWHHVHFRLRHRRKPTQADLQALGTGIRPAAKYSDPAGTAVVPAYPEPGQTPINNLADALRLRPGKS